MSDFEHIAVIGAGTMGSGIAQVIAGSGRKVSLIDTSQEKLDRGMGIVKKWLERLVAKDKLPQDEADLLLSRITPSIEVSDLAACSMVIEAIFEMESLKSEMWRKIDQKANEDAIFATNTSSISITKLAAATNRPERFIGMHFFNPVPLMKLVEVIRGNKTGDEVTANVLELAKDLGKVPVEVRDFPGFVSNRVLMPLINEAIFTVYEGVATPEAVDEVFKLGMAHPMGPLTLADFIGLDVCLHIMNVLVDGFGDPKYRPCPLLKQMVAAGKLGRKSGEGFYTYESRA